MLSAVSVPFERMTVRVGEHEINTIKAGSGPPLVLVHGFGAGIGFWCGNIDALSEKYTVYAMDMLGFGRSSRPKPNFKGPEQAEDYFTSFLEGWRQSVGLKRFVLLGHSLGGYVSACYALKHHDKIAHLILADPWGVPQKPPVEQRQLSFSQRMIVKALTLSSPLLAMRAVGPYGPSLVAKTRPDIPAKFSHILENPEVVTNYLYHSNAQSPATGELAFSHLTEGLGWAKRPLINRLPALPNTVPTTILYGSHTWMDKDAGVEMSRQMPGPVTVKEVHHSGHHIYIDNADHFNKVILKVADRLDKKQFDHIEHMHHHHATVEEQGGLTEKILTE
jgi:pimeloyl-ACP methyl ester carboxylesterase